jgi:hypothetical protein
MNIMAIRTLFKVGSKTLTTTNCFLDLLLFHNCYRSRPPPQITTLLPHYESVSECCLTPSELVFSNIILYANFFDNSAISLVNVDVVFFSNFS